MREVAITSYMFSPLQKRRPNQAQVEVLQVPEAPVDHLRGAARGALAEVVALHEGDRIAARGGVEGDPGAGDPASDDDHVEVILLHGGQRGLSGDHLGLIPGTRSPGRPAAAPAGAAPARRSRDA